MMKDFRVGIQPRTNVFGLIASHNKNVLQAKKKLSTSFSQGSTRKIATGIQTTINCGASKKLIVKTFTDGTSLVEAQHG